MLPDEAITEYIEIYKKLYGITLTKEEASFRANNLVNLYKAVLGPESTDTTKKVEKRRCDY